MTIALSVNLNKIALIRNSREGNSPDLLAFADMALAAGAEGLTIHPRPDQRHIRASDVPLLAALCKGQQGIEFNIEGNPFEQNCGSYPGFIQLVEQHQPEQCTLVPDAQDQLTSDHGFDLKKSGEQLQPIIERLKARNIRISLFMDPDLEQIDLAKLIGADRIELYTGPYAEAELRNSPDKDALFESYCRAAAHATDIGLGVNAGHDLNLDNLDKFAQLPGLLEVSIGHALTIDALLNGYSTAVRAYRNILQR